MTESLSGAEIGRKNAAALKEYLRGLKAQSGQLPARGGKVNVTAVALACGFDRGVLYQNPRCRPPPALCDQMVWPGGPGKG